MGRNSEENVVAVTLGPIVAERLLTRVGRAGSPVRVRVGKPKKDRASGDYFCPYRVEGLGRGQVQQAWGVDSVQALQSAMQAIRLVLEPHADALEWLGGQGGTLGFPKSIPDSFGVKLSRRLEKLVERETNRHARTLERAGRRRMAKKVKASSGKRRGV
jgi:hypothetical protein